MTDQRILIRTSGMTKKLKREVSRGVTRVLGEYPDYLLAEATTAEREELGLSGVDFEAEETPPRIKLRSVEFDPLQEQPPVPERAARAGRRLAAQDRRLYDVFIVQFEGPAKPEWVQAVRDLGGVITGTVPEYAFLVRLKRDLVDEVAALPEVRWVGRYEPSYKLSPMLTGNRGPSAAAELPGRSLSAEAAPATPWGNITVVLHERRDRRKVVERLERAGARVISAEKDRVRAEVEPVLLDEIVEMREVRWVEPYSLPRLHNDVAAEIVGTRRVQSGHGLDGSGQIVAVADTGLDSGADDDTMHPDFTGRIRQIQSWPIVASLHQFLDNTTWDDGPADVDSGHGTHVAGSVLGSGARSDGEITGSAPKAEVVFQAVEQWADVKTPYEGQLPDGHYLLGIPDDLGELFQAAYDSGARIHTNSWGDQEYGQYTVGSEDVDEFVWTHKDMVILYSAGNDGVDADGNGTIETDSLGSHACAKNAISVGASENDRPVGGYQDTYHQYWPNDFPSEPIKTDGLSDNPEGMAAFSSRGPTDDGLLKPDVVAPGTNILSVRSSKATGKGWGLLPMADDRRDHYMYMGGTSMATPLTAGAVALVRQYLDERRPTVSPSAAAVKAVLTHGAVTLAGQYTSPEVGPPHDPSQGWGRIDVENSLYPDPPAHLEVWDDPEDAVGTGQSHEYAFEVADGAVPLRATLVWSDHPGPGLVNRLRLSIASPTGVITEPPLAQHGNNVQRVEIESPVPGSYVLRVTGMDVATEALTGEKQDFAVALSAGLDVVDVFVRDNTEHDGTVPSVATDRESPDIWVTGVNDPEAPPATPEHGRTNHVFVRVHNRGPSPAPDADVRLHWVDSDDGAAPQSWNSDGISIGGVDTNSQQLSVPAAGGGTNGEVVASFQWVPPATGQYTLIATVDHPDDPIVREDLDGLRWDNNLAAVDLMVAENTSPGAAEVLSYQATLCNDIRFGVETVAFIRCKAVSGQRYVLVFTDADDAVDNLISDDTVVAFFPAGSYPYYIDLLRHEAPIEIEVSSDASRVTLSTKADEPPGEGDADRDVGIVP